MTMQQRIFKELIESRTFILTEGAVNDRLKQRNRSNWFLFKLIVCFQAVTQRAKVSGWNGR